MRGLEGLKGLGEISEMERQKFLLDNEDALRRYSNDPWKYGIAAERLYNNQKFKDTFGEDMFNRYDTGTREGYEFRNSMLKDKVVNDAFEREFSPFDNEGNRHNDRGLGNQWERYNRMSTDAKLRVLESDFKTPSEVDKSIEDFGNRNIFNKAAVGLLNITGFDETLKQQKREENNHILENIFSEDAEKSAKNLSGEVARAYVDQFSKLSDEEIKAAFVKAITPGSYEGNQGISEYAAFYGNGSKEDIQSEMADFTIDDMRQVLAKKAVYDSYMSPDQASIVLNNEAKRYIKDRQGTLGMLGALAKDIGISVLSYTADKFNGIYNLGLGALDMMGDSPIVMVDDRGEVIDPQKVSYDNNGRLFYVDEEGQSHIVHQEQVSRTALHNMGKNMDGSEDTSWLNAKFWTRAEQFGTLDEDLQKKYEKLGSSPFKAVWDPGEESNLWYESFKMASFGIADMALMLLPAGIGAAGKALSTASKAGKAMETFGKGMQYAGKVMGNAKVHGTAGALGIAYAYNRGAFQETLAQNLSNAEEAVYNSSKNDVMALYDGDANYRKQIDALVKAKASDIKAELLSSATEPLDASVLNATAEQRARDEVLGDLIQKRAHEKLNSDEYAALQQEAINSAGSAAFKAFLPEAIKYGIVNTVGYRKYIYQNPTGLTKKVSPTLKGLKEEVNAEGKRRLTVDASGFATFGKKAKTMGKVIRNQAWGGAWTNGTDDMMVDAAERINLDSFQRYLNSYETGEPIADVYGFADMAYSYGQGLLNSLGQETTWNAAAVGALGSTISFSPHMANIASLATKEGRVAFKNNFQKRVQRDEEGNAVKDEKGNPIIEDVKWYQNPGERLGFFIQNGVFNTYYGKKQNIKDLQNHADYVNNLLDKEQDFKVLEELLGSGLYLDVEEDNNNEGNLKTKRFIHAINTIKGLETLGKEENDPTSLSSVVESHKSIIDRAANMLKEGEEGLSEEEQKQVLDEYYSANGSIERNEANDAEALKTIAKNAEKLKEAYETYNAAEEEVSKIESSRGRSIPHDAREWMKFQKAMSKHFSERRDQMRDDIQDTSDVDSEVSDENILSVVGGVNKAVQEAVVYGLQEKEYQDRIKEQEIEILGAKDRHEKAKKELENAKDSDARFEAQKKVIETQTELEDAMQAKAHYSDALAKTTRKKEQLNNALSSHLENVKDPTKIQSLQEASRKVVEAEAEVDKAEDKVERAREAYKKVKKQDTKAKKKAASGKKAAMDAAKAELEKKKQKVAELKEKEAQAQKQSDESVGPVKVLTADEIFALDPISRAQMMNPKRRDMYSQAQQAEIEKLESRLLNDYVNPLEKIQDIAKLTHRIRQCESAFSRMAKYPDAAEVQLEKQRKRAVKAAEELIDVRQAQGFANMANQLDQETATNEEITQEQKNKFVYDRLKLLKPSIIDIIEEQELLPQYQKQISDARSWGKMVEEISSVISNTEWDSDRKVAVSNYIDEIAENATNGEELLNELKKAASTVEAATNKKELETIINGVEKLREQKDAVPVETEAEKKDRETTTEEEARKKLEEEKKKVEEAKAAAEEAAAVEKEQKAKEEEEKKAKAKQDLENGTNGVINRYSVDADAVSKITPEERANNTLIESHIKATADYLNGHITAEDYISKLGIVLFDPTEEFDVAQENVDKFKKYLKDAAKPVAEASTKEEKAAPEAVVPTPEVAEKKEEQEKKEQREEKKEEGKTEAPEQKEEKAASDEGTSKESTVSRPEGPVSNRIIVGHEKGDGASIITPVNDSNKGFSYTSDHAEFSYKGAPDSKGNKRAEQLQGVDVYKREMKDGRPVGIVVFSNDKYTHGSRGQGGYVFNIWRPLTEEEETKVRDLFNNEDFLDSVFGKSNSVNEKAEALSEAIDNIMSGVDVVIEGPKKVTVKDEKGDEFTGFEDKELKEEAEEAAQSNDKKVDVVSDGQLDKPAPKDTTQNEPTQTDEDVTISANAMDPFVDDNFVKAANRRNPGKFSEAQSRETLEHGVLRQKVGDRGDQSQVSNANDSMNNYYAWMKSRRIRLQNIIDHELHQILKANPSGVKVKFMAVRNIGTGPNSFMKTRLLLVIDFDDNINKGITRIHKDRNGGVISSTSEGKSKNYLIIGTAGYGNDRGARQAAYDRVFGKMGGNLGWIVPGMVDFFRKNEAEEFYVDPSVSTAIIPGSFDHHYLITQMENDTSKKNRDLIELFEDEERNPYGITWDTAKWMIQQDVTFARIGVENDDRIMTPTKKVPRSGNVFLLVPASNGKLMPIYINPLTYNGIRDGVLKTEVESALRQLVSKDYDVRRKALSSLSEIFHFSKDDKIILTRELARGVHETTIKMHNAEGKEVTLANFIIRDDSPQADIDKALEDIFSAMKEINPIVNITSSLLRGESERKLRKYIEAGAFTTEAALLGTAGTRYDVYALDSNKQPIIPKNADNRNASNRKTIYTKDDAERILYIDPNNFYSYRDGKYYYPNGNLIDESTESGARLVKKLWYRRQINNGKLKGVSYEGIKGWTYYIVDNGTNPIVIREKNSNHEIVELKEAEAKEVINKVHEAAEAKKRNDAAMQELQDVDLGDNTATPETTAPKTTAAPTVQQPVTPLEAPPLVPPSPTVQPAPTAQPAQVEQEVEEKKEDKPVTKPAEQKKLKQDDFLHKSMENLDSDVNKPARVTFEELLKHPKFKMKIITVIKTKWPTLKKPADIRKYLEGKIGLDSIDSSDAGIQAWIDKLENCT